MATSDFSVNGSSDEAANVQNSQPPHPEAIELNRDLNSVGARCPQHRPGTILNPVAFKALADCSDELWIELEGQLYRLRKTKQGKLILTKWGSPIAIRWLRCVGLGDSASQPHTQRRKNMPLFEIETDSHIFITWADDEALARSALAEAYPYDRILRLTKRPRNSWVISKSVLGATSHQPDLCSIARECLSKSSGDKLHAIRLYMTETGADLERARRIIESNMVMGW